MLNSSSFYQVKDKFKTQPSFFEIKLKFQFSVFLFFKFDFCKKDLVRCLAFKPDVLKFFYDQLCNKTYFFIESLNNYLVSSFLMHNNQIKKLNLIASEDVSRLLREKHYNDIFSRGLKQFGNNILVLFGAEQSSFCRGL